MKNLIIGDTSQLSYYFPEYYLRSQSNLYSYSELFNDTVSDIDKKIKELSNISLL